MKISKDYQAALKAVMPAVKRLDQAGKAARQEGWSNLSEVDRDISQAGDVAAFTLLSTAEGLAKTAVGTGETLGSTFLLDGEGVIRGLEGVAEGAVQTVASPILGTVGIAAEGIEAGWNASQAGFLGAKGGLLEIGEKLTENFPHIADAGNHRHAINVAEGADLRTHGAEVIGNLGAIFTEADPGKRAVAVAKNLGKMLKDGLYDVPVRHAENIGNMLRTDVEQTRVDAANLLERTIQIAKE
jgi:hypothetical protein